MKLKMASSDDDICAITEHHMRTEEGYNAKRPAMDMEVPHDWATFIKTCVYRRKPMNGIEMSQNDFIDIGSALKPALVHRKKDEQGNIVPWTQIKWIKIKRDVPFQFFYKTNLDDSSVFNQVDLRRGSLRTRVNHEDFTLVPLHDQLLPIADVKHDQLLDLLPYISDYNKSFVQNLKRSSDLNPKDFPALQEEI
ncbi:hypothetical protein QE152_g22377 [Popillia japonica]|uniref:Uncharacterized protein n=1 Tax=Popillia japonica TaxID=7064 RepID=A0AAW1KL87_POPJA